MNTFLSKLRTFGPLLYLLLIPLFLMGCGKKLDLTDDQADLSSNTNSSQEASNEASNNGTSNEIQPTEQGQNDSLRPSVAIEDLGSSIVNSAFNMKITFSEQVSNFSVDGITVVNGTLSNLVTSDQIVYDALVTPSSAGNVSIQINDSVTQDIVGNYNTASNSIVVNYDPTAPNPPTAIDSKAFHDPLTINLSGGEDTHFKEFRYTLTGTAPADCSDGTVAQSDTGIAISNTTTLKAISCDSVGNFSSVITKTYT